MVFFFRGTGSSRDWTPQGAEILDPERPGPPRGGRRGLAVTHRGVGDVTGQIWARSTSFKAHQHLRGVVPQPLLVPRGVLGRGAWRGRCFLQKQPGLRRGGGAK
jgi:hypothetical protein